MDFSLVVRAARRATSSTWFRLVVGGGLVAILFVRYGLEAQIAKASLVIQWPLAWMGILVSLALVCVRAWRWNLILEDLGERFPVSQLVRVYGATFFLGLVSPAKLGEAMRVWIARDKTGSIGSAAFSVAFDRVLDLVPTLFITALFGAFVGMNDHAQLLTWTRALFALMATALVMVILWPSSLYRVVDWMGRAFLARVSRKHQTNGDGNYGSNARSIKRKTLVKAVLYSLVSQSLLLLQTYLFARSVSIEFNTMVLYAVVTMASVVAALPLSIGGMGTREAAVVWSLTALGLGSTQSLAFAVLGLVNFAVVLILSSITFVLNGPHKDKNVLQTKEAVRIRLATTAENAGKAHEYREQPDA